MQAGDEAAGIGESSIIKKLGPLKTRYTGGQEKMMSKVQCLFYSESCTTEGRGGEKGGSANFQK